MLGAFSGKVSSYCSRSLRGKTYAIHCSSSLSSSLSKNMIPHRSMSSLIDEMDSISKMEKEHGKDMDQISEALNEGISASLDPNLNIYSSHSQVSQPWNTNSNADDSANNNDNNLSGLFADLFRDIPLPNTQDFIQSDFSNQTSGGIDRSFTNENLSKTARSKLLCAAMKREKNWRKVMDLFNEGLHLTDPIVYRSFIAHLGFKLGRWKLALNLFRRLKQVQRRTALKDFSEDSGYKEPMVYVAKKHYNAITMDINDEIQTYTLMINVLCSNKVTFEAIQIFQQFLNYCRKFNNEKQHENAANNNNSNNNRDESPDIATVLSEDLLNDDYNSKGAKVWPSHDLCTRVLYTCAISSNMDGANLVFRSMLSEMEYVPSVMDWKYMIEACDMKTSYKMFMWLVSKESPHSKAMMEEFMDPDTRGVSMENTTKVEFLIGSMMQKFSEIDSDSIREDNVIGPDRFTLLNSEENHQKSLEKIELMDSVYEWAIEKGIRLNSFAKNSMLLAYLRHGTYDQNSSDLVLKKFKQLFNPQRENAHSDGPITYHSYGLVTTALLKMMYEELGSNSQKKRGSDSKIEKLFKSLKKTHESLLNEFGSTLDSRTFKQESKKLMTAQMIQHRLDWNKCVSFMLDYTQNTGVEMVKWNHYHQEWQVNVEEFGTLGGRVLLRYLFTDPDMLAILRERFLSSVIMSADKNEGKNGDDEISGVLNALKKEDSKKNDDSNNHESRDALDFLDDLNIDGGKSDEFMSEKESTIDSSEKETAVMDDEDDGDDADDERGVKEEPVWDLNIYTGEHPTYFFENGTLKEHVMDELQCWNPPLKVDHDLEISQGRDWKVKIDSDSMDFFCEQLESGETNLDNFCPDSIKIHL